ncbi:MAG: putative Fe-S cluster assembly protein SufT [Opitutaceae bacterium]|jgi:probable FeS assembly SUF system protein SufT|nr:putative Fe-S cluster assembly protein SufT [Opitutaceae bacterium]
MDTERLLSREVTATRIPQGDKLPLPAGTRVFIRQKLGGSYTVQTDDGLCRVDGKDGDALGEKVIAEEIHAPALPDGSPNPDAIWDQLKKVYDPEIPVNIVDLGLVYSMEIEKDDAGGGHRVLVTMTLTAPGCGMGPAIAEDAKAKVLCVPGVTDASVNLTWEPPWSQEMISEEGRMILGLV